MKMKVIPTSDRPEMKTDMEENEHLKRERKNFDKLMQNIHPFILAMKILSGYFETGEQKQFTRSGINSPERRWNFWRIYATLVMLLSWANVLRYCAAFSSEDGFGPGLFLKLFYFILLVDGTFCRTVSYIACSCGTIQKTLLDISRLQYKEESFRKLTLCCLVWMVTAIFYSASLFVYHGMIYTGLPLISNYQIEPLVMDFKLNRGQDIAAKVVAIILMMFNGGGSGLPLFLALIVTYTFRGEFLKIKTNMKHQFQPEIETLETARIEFEQLRKRHQKLTEILRDADKFLSFAIGTVLVSTLATTILVLYSLCFATQMKTDLGVMMTYSSYATVAFSSLIVISGCAIVINEAV